MEAASKKAEDQRVRKPAPPQVQGKEAEYSPGEFETTPPVAGGLEKLPNGPGTRQLRQAAVLQMQRTHGNSFVMRQIEDGQAAQAPAADSGTPTKISDGASTVETAGGVVNISGGVVNINSAMTQTSGVLRASTIMADSVVASSYTPGAGNIW
jgi:hypothetical protein